VEEPHTRRIVFVGIRETKRVKSVDPVTRILPEGNRPDADDVDTRIGVR